MKKYKNTELAKLYKVSEKTIRNWIEAAEKEKIDLDLVKESARSYIANTASNHLLLLDLSKKGRKFKNKKALSVVCPKKEFYEVFNEDQIIDLVADLEANKEIDLKHVYFRAGEKSWDEYVKGALTQKASNTPKNTIQLLDLTKEYIYELVKNNRKINIIDIGVGNGMTVKFFLEFLMSKNVINKYIGIDYSPDVIKTAESNLRTWFNDKFTMEFHIRDITAQGLKDILFVNAQNDDENDVQYSNLILFIGSTIENQRLQTQALNIIKNSMGPSDLFVLGQTLDAYTLKIENKLNMAGNEAFLFILDLLNISSNMFELKGYYDEKIDSRFILADLKADVKIFIETKKIRKYISLSSKDSIILLRHKHHKLSDVVYSLSEIGFDILNITTSLDHANVNTISRLHRQEIL